MAVYLNTTLLSERVTPSGHRRVEASYVTMRDGVRIAIDVVFPSGLSAAERVPTVVNATRYWRAKRVGALRRLLIGLKLDSELGHDGEIEMFSQAEYVVVLVDARGSGASFGQRKIEWSPDEILDYGEIIDWIAGQSWSNGRVGTYGVSYDGNTAELSAANRRPALKVVAPLYADFDPQFGIGTSRGIMSEWFVRAWSDYVAAQDRNEWPCSGWLSCIISRVLGTGVKPVDADPNEALLRQALAEHRNVDVLSAVVNAPYRDDHFGASGLTLSDVSPFHFREQIESSGVAYYVNASWIDSGTIDGALSRYRSFSNSQHLTLAFRSHGGEYDANPFKPQDAPVVPSLEKQWQQVIAFFDRFLKNESTPSEPSTIDYETAGLGWRTTRAWPPDGLQKVRYYFASNQALSLQPPSDTEGVDTYQVDFRTGSGTQTTRWHTGFRTDVFYADRKAVDHRLLSYTTEPIVDDVEITGNAIVTLHMTSSFPDGAFVAYLEDVAPEGRVTYLTEGELRAIHHGVSQSAPLFVQEGPWHSFYRADSQDLRADVPTAVEFTLYATSVVIRAGHRIRLSLAGGDADVFARYPPVGIPLWHVFRGGDRASHIDLPLRALTSRERQEARDQATYSR